MTTPKDPSATIRPRTVNAAGAPVCARCGISISHRRTNVRFCKPQCSKDSWRLANPDVDKASKTAWRQRVITQKAEPTGAELTAHALVNALKARVN